MPRRCDNDDELTSAEGKGAWRVRQGFGTELIGWLSSVVLVLTIGKQVYKQWQEGSSENVSKWLFAGQLAASIGFTVYSWLVRNWVFVVTNSVMILNGLAGLLIMLYHSRRAARKEQDPRGASDLQTDRA
jgi:MtN3 and saliva related transmembrane protein